MALAHRTTMIWLVSIYISLLSACSRDCFVADTYDEIRDSRLSSKHLYLYIRTTGFNEKESLFQLYSIQPVFDECGIPSVEPVAEEHVDTSAGNVDKLIIDKNRIILVYSKNTKTSLNKVSLELR